MRTNIIIQLVAGNRMAASSSVVFRQGAVGCSQDSHLIANITEYEYSLHYITERAVGAELQFSLVS
jgi:hypothetical protein